MPNKAVKSPSGLGRQLGCRRLGDAEPIGEALSEFRIHYGPGYRVYFKQKGKVLLLVLCGGTKKTQSRDIERAKSLAKKYEDILNEWS